MEDGNLEIPSYVNEAYYKEAETAKNHLQTYKANTNKEIKELKRSNNIFKTEANIAKSRETEAKAKLNSCTIELTMLRENIHHHKMDNQRLVDDINYLKE